MDSRWMSGALPRQDHAQELLAMVERQNLQPEGRQWKNWGMKSPWIFERLGFIQIEDKIKIYIYICIYNIYNITYTWGPFLHLYFNAMILIFLGMIFQTASKHVGHLWDVFIYEPYASGGPTTPRVFLAARVTFFGRRDYEMAIKCIWVFPKIVGFPPKSSILIGFSIIFTIHFGGKSPIFGNTHMKTRRNRIVPFFSSDRVRLTNNFDRVRSIFWMNYSRYHTLKA